MDGRNETPAEVPVSIVIFTRNRAGLLRGAIESLLKQTVDRSLFEVVVVDNQSTDATPEVMREAEAQGVRCFVESRIGQSMARNRGWRESRGEYVGFLDDDGRAAGDWVEKALQIIRDRRPDFFGGPFHPFYESPKPAWFKDEYGSRELSPVARVLAPSETLSGSNMFVRRSLLEKYGGFSESYGTAGRKVAYGEETELQFRLRRLDPAIKGYYDPELKVLHLVRSEKLKLGWHFRRIYPQTRDAVSILHEYESRDSIGRILWRLVKTIVRMILSPFNVFTRDRRKYPYIENYMMEVVLHSMCRVLVQIFMLGHKLSLGDR